MTITIALATVFIGYLAWICFLSFVVSRVAYQDALPERRAALTAGTAFLLAVAGSLITIFFVNGPFLFIPADRGWALLGMLIYIPAALIDWLMLRRAFRKAWTDDAEPFL